MTYTQIRDANWKVPYIGGWCEGFVEGAWGQASLPNQDSKGNWYTTGVYDSAIAKWNANPGNGNHPGELPPSGVTVPVYFSLGDVADGHTAISLDDGSVASSTQAGTHPQGFIHPNLQNLIDIYAKYNGGCTYLGWSEYVGTVRVVQPVTQPSQGGDTEMITDSDNEYGRWNKLAYQIRGRNFTREEFQASAVGQTWLHAMEILSDDAEANAATHAQDIGQVAVKDDWQGQISGLQAQLKTEQDKGVGLAKNLNDSQLQLDAANEEVKQAESIASDDAAKINDLTVKLAAANKAVAAANATIQQLEAADKPVAAQPTGTVVPPTSQATNPPLTPPKTSTWLTTVVDWLVSALKRNG